MKKNGAGGGQRLPELVAGYRKGAEAAYIAITKLDEVARMSHLSSDIPEDLDEMIGRLYVRAGHAEGEMFGIGNWLEPIVTPLSGLLENAYHQLAARSDDTSKDLLQSTEPEAYNEGFVSGEKQGVLIGVSLALAIIEEALDLDLWKSHDFKPDREEILTYF